MIKSFGKMLKENHLIFDKMYFIKTKVLINKVQKRENNFFYSRTHSIEFKVKISEVNNSMHGKISK